LTRSRPEKRWLAVTVESSRSAMLGGVSSTSEGSFGPAVAPWVYVPCDGAPLASELSEKANSEINKADAAAIATATDANKSRRISPPPARTNRVGDHSNLIRIRIASVYGRFFRKYLPSCGFFELRGVMVGHEEGRGRSSTGAPSICLEVRFGSVYAPVSTGRRTASSVPASESQRVISTLFSVKKRTPSLPVACRSP
jgi:hypothetical protein